MFESLIKEIQEIYKGSEAIILHAPVLGEADKQSMINVIESGFVSSVGKEVTLFEEKIAKYTGSAKAVAVVNGTAALHLGLLLSDVKRGDLVITQALTFIATANAISYIGAEPIFLDSDFDTMGLSPKALEDFLNLHATKKDNQAFHKATGKRISACVPMHVFGHPVRIKEILTICKSWGINVVEDAAESLGSKLDGQHTGTFAPIGILSFNGNKIITTGGGGALLFQDEKLAARAKHLSTTAKIPHPWAFYHDEVGFNYRMPNLNAALGCSQMERLDSFLSTKKAIAQKYAEALKDDKSLTFVEARKGTDPNYWLNAVLVPNLEIRDQLLKKTNELGIGCRPVWELMCDLKIFSGCIKDDLKVARQLQERIVNLPSGVPCQ